MDTRMEIMELELPVGTGANKQLPDPYLINYYEQAENRTIWLDTELGESGVEIVKKIMRWNYEDKDMGLAPEDRKPIRVVLMSPGGDIYAMLAILDAIMLSQTPVYTYVVGQAASAACVILLSGHKRYAFPHSHAMWHSGSAGMSGTMGQIQDVTKHLDVVEDQMSKFLLDKTHITAKQLKKYKDRDWYFTADQMLEYGMVDAIVESLDEIL